jgi:integrase
LLCRPAELFFIEREGVLWDKQEVLIKVADNSAGDPKRPKNRNPRRIILPPPAAEAARIVPPRLDVPWLFYTQTGRRFSKSTLLYYWNPVRTLFGKPGMDFYELKHAGASHYVNELDIDPADVAFQIGHTDGGRLVRSTYGHPEEKRARDRMQEAFRERMRNGDHR